MQQVSPAPVISSDAKAAGHEAASEAVQQKVVGGRLARWIAKFGLFGFLFFLIKGLLWLAVPALVIAWRGS